MVYCGGVVYTAFSVIKWVVVLGFQMNRHPRVVYGNGVIAKGGDSSGYKRHSTSSIQQQPHITMKGDEATPTMLPPSTIRQRMQVDDSYKCPAARVSSDSYVLWYPLSPVAALWSVASVPSSYLAGVIACLADECLACSFRRHSASKRATYTRMITFTHLARVTRAEPEALPA